MESPIFLRIELQQLLQRLAQLVQAMGNQHRPAGLPGNPASRLPTASLRPTYLRLLQQAASVAQRLGIEAAEAPAYVTNQLVMQLRTMRPAQPHPSPRLAEAADAQQ